MLNSILVDQRNQAHFNKSLEKQGILHFISYLDNLARKEQIIFTYLYKALVNKDSLYISQSKIAKECEVSRKHVNATLKKFKQDSLITYHGDLWCSNTYILNDVMKTQEFKIRYFHIFKIQEDIVIADGITDNYIKEANSSVKINHVPSKPIESKNVTLYKEIRIYRDLDSQGLLNSSSLFINQAAKTAAYQEAANKEELLKLLSTTTKLPEATSFDKCCNIICETVNLKNFKEQKRTSIMEVTISPGLRKATEFLNLNKYGQYELMRFNDDTLNAIISKFDRRNYKHPEIAFKSFKDKCFNYIKEHNISVNKKYFDVRHLIPANARFTLSQAAPETKEYKERSANEKTTYVQEDKINSKIPTAIELANEISVFKANREQTLEKWNKCSFLENPEDFFNNILTNRCYANYSVTGEEHEDLAIQYINEHRNLYKKLEIPDEKEKIIETSPYVKSTFFDDIGVKPVEKVSTIQYQLQKIFPDSDIEHMDPDLYEEVL